MAKKNETPLYDENYDVVLKVKSNKAAGKEKGQAARDEQGDEYSNVIEFTRKFGEGLQDAVEKHGEETVFGMYIQQAKTKCGQGVRYAMESTDDDGAYVYNDEQVVELGNRYTPGVKFEVPKAVSNRELALQEIEAAHASGDTPDVPAIFAKYGIG